ncbi:unnamed protein product, partial [Pleuronectes platessa]
SAPVPRLRPAHSLRDTRPELLHMKELSAAPINDFGPQRPPECSEQHGYNAKFQQFPDILATNVCGCVRGKMLVTPDKISLQGFLKSWQLCNMDNSDEPEDLLDGKIVFQKNKDRTFSKTK